MDKSQLWPNLPYASLKKHWKFVKKADKYCLQSLNYLKNGVWVTLLASGSRYSIKVQQSSRATLLNHSWWHWSHSEVCKCASGILYTMFSSLSLYSLTGKQWSLDLNQKSLVFFDGQSQWNFACKYLNYIWVHKKNKKTRRGWQPWLIAILATLPAGTTARTINNEESLTRASFRRSSPRGNIGGN